MRSRCSRRRIAPGTGPFGARDRVGREHVEHCLSCQAELARHTRLVRLLAELRHDIGELPPGALPAIFERLERGAERKVLESSLCHRRVAVLPGLMVLAVAFGLALWRRSRSTRPRTAEA